MLKTRQTSFRTVAQTTARIDRWRSRSTMGLRRRGVRGLPNLLPVLLPILLWALPASSAEASDRRIDRVEVQAMVDAAIERLLETHHPSRHWDPEVLPEGGVAQPTGRTALVALALLEAGVPAQTGKLLDAIQALATTPATGTYAIAARLMVWTRLPAEFRPLAEKELQRLLENFSREAGGWDYGPNPRAYMVDHSLTQFAMQAIADADRAGLAVPPALIDQVRSRFLGRQRADGGWAYREADDDSRGSMTAAGLATMALCERMRPGNARVREAVARSIDGAVAWLDRNFDPGTNPGVGDHHVYYWIHSLDRAGRATGLRVFRGRDWFDACAGVIRDRLFAGNVDVGIRVASEPLPETLAFALFTLQRGLEPVPFGFLDTSGHPPAHDELGLAADLLADVIEKPVGWTRLGIDDPLDVWTRLPVVVVRGEGAAAWIRDPESPTVRRLLDYAAGGGVVVAAPTDRGRFAKELSKRFLERFPHLRESKIDAKASVRAEPTPWRGRADQLDTPVRRWLVAAPRVPLGRDGRDRNAEDAGMMLSAVLLASTGGDLPSRAGLAEVAASPSDRETAIARYRHDGNWQPEPAALQRLVRLGRERGLSFSIEDDAAGVISGPGILWVTGTTERDAEGIDLDILATSVTQGRSLVVESLDAAFTTSLAARMSAEGWMIEPAPTGLPVGTARIRAPGGVAGLLVTAEVSRFLMGRPTTTGLESGDVLAVVRRATEREEQDD